MKKTNALITGLIFITLTAIPVFAQEKGTSDNVLLYLPSSVYRQIPIEDAKRMKNYTPVDQYHTSVAPDSSSDTPKTENDKTN